MLAIDPARCDMERVRDFVPELGEVRTSPLALIDPVFLATPGSFWSLLAGRRCLVQSQRVDAERGEEFLRWATSAVVNLVRDMEDVHDRIGVRA